MSVLTDWESNMFKGHFLGSLSDPRAVTIMGTLKESSPILLNTFWLLSWPLGQCRVTFYYLGTLEILQMTSLLETEPTVPFSSNDEVCHQLTSGPTQAPSYHNSDIQLSWCLTQPRFGGMVLQDECLSHSPTLQEWYFRMNIYFIPQAFVWWVEVWRNIGFRAFT